MIPSGSPSPIGGSQPLAPSLLRTNSSLLGGGHGNSFQSHSPFASLTSPRPQFNTNELLSNISNVSSLLNQSFGNGMSSSGGGLAVPSINIQNQGSIRGGVAEITGHSETNTVNTIPFASSSGSFHGQQLQKPSGNQNGLDHHPHSQLYEGMQNFQQQFSAAQSQQQKLLGGLNSLNNMPSVKLEPQMVAGDPNASAQQLQALRNMGSVRMEQQQLQNLTNLTNIKTEHQHSDPSMLLQRQQPPLLHLSRQSPQAAAQMSLLQQQQRMFHLQQQQQQQQHQQQHQQQQQQIVNTLPWQRSQLQQQQQQQQQQQLHQQNLSVRPHVKPSSYEPGSCARRLTHYMYHQQHRPEDNNIEFWRKFVLDYFAPNARKRWCVSLYGSGRQTTGVFPQDVWHCEICNRKPGRGFETTVEVLPRLCQIKYASGTLEELLYVDMPREYFNAFGQIVLDYAKAIQESVFDQLRVVRDGQLRVVFNQDLKIASWEFCARRHEELIPRRLIIPQVSQLGAVLHKYQANTQNSSSMSAQELQNTCNSFVASSRQLAKSLEVPLVNDLGYTKRYVRCLQISEVVNSMKDLIDYSKETGTGPMDSLINFPRGLNTSSGFTSQQTHQLKDNQNSSHQTSIQVPPVPSPATGNGPATSLSTSTTSINSILLSNSTTSSKQENHITAVNSAYGGANTVQTPSSNSSLNPSSPFFPSMPTSHFSSRNSYTSLSSIEQPVTNDSQSNMQQILQEMLMSPPHVNGVSATAHELKGIGARSALNGGNCLVGNGNGGIEFGEMGTDINNNAMLMAGRVGISHMSPNLAGMNHQLQQDFGSRLLGGLGAVNGFNGLQFD